MSDKWKKLESMLSGVFGEVQAVADGYDLIFRKGRSGEKLVVSVYVNGWIKGEWSYAENGKPVHSESRFWRPMKRRSYKLNQYKVLKKVFGKKKADEMIALKVIGFLPSFGSPRALISHFKKHFPDLELVEEK